MRWLAEGWSCRGGSHRPKQHLAKDHLIGESIGVLALLHKAIQEAWFRDMVTRGTGGSCALGPAAWAEVEHDGIVLVLGSMDVYIRLLPVCRHSSNDCCCVLSPEMARA